MDRLYGASAVAGSRTGTKLVAGSGSASAATASIPSWVEIRTSEVPRMLLATPASAPHRTRGWVPVGRATMARTRSNASAR